MPPKRKRTTNRKKDESLLNVKLRNDQAKAQRTKTFTSVISVLFGILFIAFLAWRGIDWALDEFVYHNPAFAIQKIEVNTDGYLTRETILHWADVKGGDNLMGLDLNHIKRNLERIPVIATASLERILPDVLRVKVAERRAVARVTMLLPHASGYYPATIPLDPQGYVLVPLQRNHVKDARVLNYGALPELKGVDETELRTSGLLQSPNVLAALRLVENFRRSNLVGTIDLQEIDIRPSGILVVSTTAGAKVKFSSGHDLQPQLLRWRQIHDDGRRKGLAIVDLDLSITNNVPTKWRSAALPNRKADRSVPPRRHSDHPKNA
jgi:cell division septal protein FtsQ